MSKIKLTGENSGYVEISAGQNAGNNTLETPTSGTRLVAHEGSQDVTLNANLTVNGVLTYDDVTNIDSVGIVTAQSGIHVTGGSVGIGTDNPSNLLHVHGQSRFEDYLRGNSTHNKLYILDDVAISATKKLYFDGGSNTYIDEVSADTLRFSTAGTERLHIDSSGHLLHGVTADEDTSGSGGVRFINAGDVQIDGDQQALVFRSTNNTAQLQSAIEWWNENGAGVQAKIACDRTAVNYAPSDLVFYTNANVDTSANNSEGDITERLRITSGGQLNLAGNMQFTAATPELEFNNGGPRFRVPAANTLTIHTGGGLGATSNERLRITSGGNIGINCNNPGSMLELNAAAGTKMGISLGAVGDNITASRYIGICKSADQTDLGANSGFSGIEFGGPHSTNEGYLAFHTHDLGVESGERIRLTKDGKFGVGLTSPESKVQIRNTTTHGKDTYATANTGGSQTPPTGTFKWDNVTPVAGHGRGYEAWVQSGDAYPNASNYIDVLIRNASFYRITLKRSHSSADAAVCQMMIYGLANSGNSNYPVVHMNGAMGSGTSTATVQSGNGRGSSNAVASFYWEIHSYNVNTHDTIIRITTTGSNNQGIVALIEEI